MKNLSTAILRPSAYMRESCYKKATRFAAGGDPIDPAQKFDWFITGHFGKHKQFTADKMCSHFRNKVDNLMASRCQRLYKMLWIEQGAQLHSKAIGTEHAHWIFEHPAHLSPMEFELQFKRLWAEICGSTNVDIRPIRNERGGIDGIIEYCGKEAEYGNFGTFIEICSDNARAQKDRQSFSQSSLFKAT